VRSLLDEMFGAENFVGLITFRKTSGATGDFLGGVADYVVWFARDRDRAKYRQLFREKGYGAEGAAAYKMVELPDGTRRALTAPERENLDVLPEGSRIFRPSPLTSEALGREKGDGAASGFHG